MSRLKKSPLLLALALLLVGLPLLSAGGATNNGDVVVKDHQLVLQEVDSTGKVSAMQVVDWLALDGDGTVNIERTTGMDMPPKVSGVRGFKTPEVKGDLMTWKDVNVSGQPYITQNKLNKDDVEPALEEIPLETKWRYWLDGRKVTDLKDIAGKSGHFRMELYMKNTSKKKQMVTYKDSITGLEKTEMVEVYLPLVIQPYDWYFDNTVFNNVKADKTGMIFYLPTNYQIGWSIPLFPPATEESHTIWVEADVKDFSMEPLTLAIAFLFPKTNQIDPIPQFAAGLNELYGGVTQLGAGLSEAVLGLGSAGTSDTLIYGINSIAGGLEQLVDPSSGLPYAENGLSTQLIPGVDTAIAGIGTAETPDTLLYGTNAITQGLTTIQGAIGTAETPDTLLYGTTAVTQGLMEVQAGIGSPTAEDTLLYAAAQVAAGLEEIKAGIGTPTEDGTLLNGLYQVKLGLDNPSGVPQDGVKQGLEELLAAIGDPAAPPAGTLLYYLNTIAGWTAVPPAAPGALTVKIATAAGGMGAAATSLTVGGSGLADATKTYIESLPGGVWGAPVSTGFSTMATTLGTLATSLNGSPGNALYYVGAINQMAAGMAANLTAKYPELEEGIDGVDQLVGGVDALSAGLEALKAAIGNASTEDTLLYGVNAISGGLDTVNAAIGSAETPDTLLYGTNAVSGGLTQLSQGIGSAETPDTLLYGSNAVFSGLSLMKGSMSTGSMANPGLKEGLQQIEGGLGEAVAGIGSTGSSNTLLWGAGQVDSGLNELKAGLEKAVNEGTNVMVAGLTESIDQLDLTQGELAAIEQRGNRFDTFLGRIEEPSKTKSDVRFMIQTHPVQNSATNSAWIIALVISIIAGLGLVAGGIFAIRRFA